MARRLEGGLGGDTLYDFRGAWEPDAFFCPASALEHSSYVVSDPDLALNEEGVILASLASDARAPEDISHLCHPGDKGLFDEVMEALRALDRQVKQGAGASTLFRDLLRTTPPLGRWPCQSAAQRTGPSLTPNTARPLAASDKASWDHGRAT
jgi:hypothetical protein